MSVGRALDNDPATVERGRDKRLDVWSDSRSSCRPSDPARKG